MIYLFFDETYRNAPDNKRFVIGCVGAFRENWFQFKPKIALLGQLRQKWVKEHLLNLMNEMDAFACLGYANVPLKLIPKGAIHSVVDVPGLSKTDSIWSRCLTMA